MSTREIRTSNAPTACDVCGRTLLRGERAEVYLNGASRRSVCELCKSRALEEGWSREGTIPAYGGGEDASQRRPSILHRLRQRREPATVPTPPALGDELDQESWSQAPARLREPRHVRAVPTSVEQKIVSAVELFNSSEHPRTVAGVARSLGMPVVSVRPSEIRASAVNLVVSWELCWYRYEVDLSDERSSVRSAGQGYELHELSPGEREPNAHADEQGRLSLAT
ncbi:MAG: hypothetical protein M3Y17_04935 [Actinomycetota bacterium]|nr:hypothetical protein [Actinomycetota bacterium]